MTHFYGDLQRKVLDHCAEWDGWQGLLPGLADLCGTDVPTLLVALQLLADQNRVGFYLAHVPFPSAGWVAWHEATQIHIDVLEAA